MQQGAEFGALARRSASVLGSRVDRFESVIASQSGNLVAVSMTT